MLAHCPAFRAARERPPGLPACARPLEHWFPCLPLPASQAVRAPGPPEADWPGDPANILPDWTVPSDGCFPGLTCTALTNWPAALRVTGRNTVISASLVSLKKECGFAFLHTLVDPSGQRPPIFCQLRQHHPPVVAGIPPGHPTQPHRLVHRPADPGHPDRQHLAQLGSGPLSLSRRSRSGTNSPGDRPWDDLSSAFPLAGRLTKPATD